MSGALNNQERFLNDVRSHEMIVLHESGTYRHLRFKRPGTGCMHFDLVTYPGHLVMSGDMGTWVFSRLDDMFEFFRTDRPRSGNLRINLGYWSEKLQAVDGNRTHAGCQEFSKEKFERVIKEQRMEWMRDGRFDKAQRRELWEAIDEEILRLIDDGETAAYQAANDFAYPPSWSDSTARRARFSDLWDHDFKEYTHHFVWACYAIAWGIHRYDEAKSPMPTKEAA
ncbi:MAG: hypothetical protein EOP24_26160 [Hyphomicrobiales bacterium]|nr:MAG: hypothetical protein EOP24_26160 [Hyphomicrobiales bacterium]